MDWSTVGTWLKDNAGAGAALVGSLVTSNVPGAIAAGISLMSSATGEAVPEKVLAALQNDKASMLRLRELALQEDASIRDHIRLIHESDLKDRQAEHEQTQLTIRSGDNAEDKVVRRTRPYQSWASLLMAFAYVTYMVTQGKDPSGELLTLLLALPWAYAGLRTWDKRSENLSSLPRKAG